MNRVRAGLAILALVAVAPAVAEVTAADAFEGLKAMAGDWYGTIEGEGAEAEPATAEPMKAHHQIQVSAAGTVVMETMGPGTQYEMINMYHLDGEDLVLTHYCASGNQPTMRLDRAASDDSRLVFTFTGGSNLDPAVDEHIHSAEIRMLEDGTVDSVWAGWQGGEPAGVMTFHLERGE